MRISDWSSDVCSSDLAGAAFAFHVVGVGPLAGTWACAIEVLAPEQELDRVVASGDVRFGAGQFVEAGQQLGVDFAGVDLVFANLQFAVGDDIGCGARVTEGVLVVALDVIDQDRKSTRLNSSH